MSCFWPVRSISVKAIDSSGRAFSQLKIYCRWLFTRRATKVYISLFYTFGQIRWKLYCSFQYFILMKKPSNFAEVWISLFIVNMSENASCFQRRNESILGGQVWVTLLLLFTQKIWQKLFCIRSESSSWWKLCSIPSLSNTLYRLGWIYWFLALILHLEHS